MSRPGPMQHGFDTVRRGSEKLDAKASCEEALCALFAETLGRDHVGPHDDLFELGGHSLTAIRLLVRIRATLGEELKIKEIFDFSTPAALAGRLTGAAADGARAPLTRVERPDVVPLSFPQRRLWFLHRMEGRSATYNVPLALRLTGTVDAEALHTALLDVVGRHESLRTVFPDVHGEPYQLIRDLDEADFRWERRSVPEADLERTLRETARHTFDLSTEIPFRAWLFDTDAEHSTLLLLLHHIAGDGWSMAPLTRDVVEAYTARVEQRDPKWSELPAQYVDYTLWQRDRLGDVDDPESVYARQLDYWRAELADLPEQVTFPTDRPRPATACYEGTRVDLT
uniref:condensation domain-containing protein n=1 Tax=Streptomyces sp. AA1529 TaxID=1203257 RepID=UPI003D708997